MVRSKSIAISYLKLIRTGDGPARRQSSVLIWHSNRIYFRLPLCAAAISTASSCLRKSSALGDESSLVVHFLKPSARSVMIVTPHRWMTGLPARRGQNNGMADYLGCSRRSGGVREEESVLCSQDSLAEGGVGSELLSAQFPASREKYREFAVSYLQKSDYGSPSCTFCGRTCRHSVKSDQGINRRVSGNEFLFWNANRESL